MEETAEAGSALPAVIWAQLPSILFNRLPVERHHPGQTNLPFSAKISKHVCGNYFTAVLGSNRSLLLREERGECRGDIYFSVDLKLIMILN